MGETGQSGDGHGGSDPACAAPEHGQDEQQEGQLGDEPVHAQLASQGAVVHVRIMSQSLSGGKRRADFGIRKRGPVAGAADASIAAVTNPLSGLSLGDPF